MQVIVWMKDQMDLNAIRPRLAHLNWSEQRVKMVEMLKHHAQSSQRDLLEFLKTRPEAVQVVNTFWIGNCLSIRATSEVIKQISRRRDVGAIETDITPIELADIPVAPSGPKYNNCELNLKVINAHKLWKLGYTGKGTIVMNIDTGVELTHPALQASWRGNEPGVLPEHAWHDPYFGNPLPTNVPGPPNCGAISPHGTGTMGIMVGLDPNNQDTLGVAFGAQWIAATVPCTFDIKSAVFDALQWGTDPDGNPATTDDVPVVINCSLRSDQNPETNSTCGQNYVQLISNVEALGTAVIYASGNTVGRPMSLPARNSSIWAIGAVDATNFPNYTVAPFESNIDCNGVPDQVHLRAPGVNIRVPWVDQGQNTYYIVSGTSESTPHIAGAIALLKEAFPNKTGPELRRALFDTQLDLKLIDVEAALFHLGVVVNQVREDGTQLSGTTIGHWDGFQFVEYPIPKAFEFSEGTQQTLRAKQDTVHNPIEKYHHWNEESNVVNHQIFDITSKTTVLTSHFQQTVANVTLQNRFLSAPAGTDPSNDVIDFKDPWLIDYPDPNYGNNKRNRGMNAPFKSRPSPFNPDYTTDFGNGDIYRGVFLNQGLPNWQPPYYSVRAASQQTFSFHGQSIPFYFVGWEGDNVDFQHPEQTETAVVFKADGAEARALYKGHLVSSRPTATAFNNGWKLAWDEALFQYHLVYADGGRMFRTQSAGAAGPWSPEETLSLGPGSDCCASVHFYEGDVMEAHGEAIDPSVLSVVWDRAEGGVHRPVLRYRSYPGSWSNEVLWPDDDNALVNSTPAVARIRFGTAPAKTFVLCRSQSGLALLELDESSDAFTVVANPVPGTGPNSRSPALASPEPAIPEKLFLVWEDGEAI